MAETDFISRIPRQFLRTVATVVLAISGLLVVSQAQANCELDVICIKEEKTRNGILLQAENLSPFPITYTLRVRARNLSSGGPETVTRTLAALESHEIMTLTQSRKNVDTKIRYNYDWTFGDRDAIHDNNYVYRLPYESGKSYRVIQGYGSRFSHTGLEQFATDFRMREGTPVHAARDGVVAKIEESNSLGCWRDGCGAHANYVVVVHNDGTTGEYYHLQQDGALVDVGERVFAGQKIALSGNTGHTTIPHLHFAVYRAVDWGNTQSIAARFATADGMIERTRRGGRYQATPIRQASRSMTSTRNYLSN